MKLDDGEQPKAFDGDGESRWLSEQAKSGGAGLGAWEISPATRS
jgi:hypothetical protein